MKQNSVVIINWEDREFLQRMETSLRKNGFVKREDYEQVGAHTQVWEKASNPPNALERKIGDSSVDMTFVEAKAGVVTA